ncbi:cobyric acid synthase [Paenibacillus sp. YYML68]|uniref:cobyric acid synthase n=1 Tax=Paenibacillus sp. YYML68 TaxID=2909250 RepID=UPI00248FB98D|nr:cobyric acid synthase [Paenibacillus sp. YYML68]
MKLERYGHGGDLRTAAELYGAPEGGFLDFSSNMNPFGPPAAVRLVMAESWSELVHYPDPAVRELTQRLAQKHGVDAACILVGNGAAELIELAVRVLRPQNAAVARPSFVEYEDALRKAGSCIHDIALEASDGFQLKLERLERTAAVCDLVFLGHPNNPTGQLLPRAVLDWCRALPEERTAKAVIDEAFLDFVPEEEQLSLARAASSKRNLIVIRSMTKFYAIPGIRLGYAVAHPDVIRGLKQLQVPWSVNAVAQRIGCAVLDDADYASQALAWLPEARRSLVEGLRQLGLCVYDSDVNFVLFSTRPLGLPVRALQEEMGRRGVLIRDASTFAGLDETYGRLAVKREQEHAVLLRTMAEAIAALQRAASSVSPTVDEGAASDISPRAYDGAAQASVVRLRAGGTMTEAHRAGEANDAVWAASAPPTAPPTASQLHDATEGPHLESSATSKPPSVLTKRAAVLMLQGTASDVGKSLLTAALCRILLQDGKRVAPFKSQNMSLNSYVTPDGKEIGRAQGMQADACRIAATTDMNPILLKPKKDMVSQVVVHGKPYKDLDARTYREQYLPEAEAVVKEALERLRLSCDVVVLEGAGSPAEVNLKSRDIVNMRLAGWADAPVLLIADIDRGGVFASLVGTLEILTLEERDRVKGFIINKFRGDVTLLKPGLDWLEAKTGKPVLGVIPYLPELGLEDEDSASLERKLSAGTVQTEELAGSKEASGEATPASSPKLDIVVIRHPRLSNFTDIDPLLQEPDVRVRFVSSAAEFGQPDAVIVPGSKNTVDDLLYLRSVGLDRAIAKMAAADGWVVGICAGYQMLGRRLLDPLLVESDQPELAGLGLFPTETVFAAEKRTIRVEGRAEVSWESGRGSGEEASIHAVHGVRRTAWRKTSEELVEGIRKRAGEGDTETDNKGVSEGTSEAVNDQAARLTLYPITGYEIHMGRTSFLEPVRHPFRLKPADTLVEGAHHAHNEVELPDGCISPSGRQWGTYVHGVLHNDDFRRAFLNELRKEKGWSPLPASLRFQERREAAFDRLAEHVRAHLDMSRIYEMIEEPVTPEGGN